MWGMIHTVPTGRPVLWVICYPGFHPGLFSFAPYGSNGEAWTDYDNHDLPHGSLNCKPLISRSEAGATS